METNRSINELVNSLPEIYQNIYGHSEYQVDSSRVCTDREKYIVEIISDLQKYYEKKELKVLDIGCAQGYYSITLAKMGCKVRGIDYLKENIELCNALKDENQLVNCRFDNCALTENFVDELNESYDVILATSVLHHVAMQNGFEKARGIFEKLVSHSKVLIVEMAVKEEPVFWNEYLPTDYTEWFINVGFYNELDFFGTHLSEIKRPFIVCSNEFGYLNHNLYRINNWEKKSFDGKQDDDSKRYLFTDDYVIKIVRKSNKEAFLEIINEIEFFNKNKDLEFANILIESRECPCSIIEVNSKIEGDLLWDIFRNEEIDINQVAIDILDELICLEERGVYHGDIRIWNIIYNKEKNKSFLIDFGNIQDNYEDSIAMGMNLSKNFTVYDAFVSLVYDLVTKNSYDSISSCNKYNLSYVYNLVDIDEHYSNFIKAYLLNRENIDYIRIKELFVKYAVDFDMDGFSLKDDQQVIMILLKRIKEVYASVLDLKIEEENRYINSVLNEERALYFSSLISEQQKQYEELSLNVEKIFNDLCEYKDNNETNINRIRTDIVDRIDNHDKILADFDRAIISHDNMLQNHDNMLQNHDNSINRFKNSIFYKIYKRLSK